MKKDIMVLFQDERVWNALTLLSDDSHSGDYFIKSSFLINDFSDLREKVDSLLFSNLINKYEKYNFGESLIKFSKIIVFIKEKSFLDDDQKREFFNKDLSIVQKKTLS